MGDYVRRFLLKNGDVRGELVGLHESYQIIMRQHNYPEHVQLILGEVLVVAVLLTNTLKFEGELTIQLQSEGVVKLLVAKCTHQMEIRGVAQWDRKASVAEFTRAFGQGQLVITIQPKNKTQYYQSVVPLQRQSVAKAIEHYFLQSEQLSTRIWLAVDDQQATGMLLQLLPGVESEPRQEFWDQIVSLTEQVTPQQLLHEENLPLLTQLFGNEEISVFDPLSVEFFCPCTVERMQRAIITLGEEDANTLLMTAKAIEVTCEFCNRQYAFDQVDVAQIFANKKDRPLH